MNIFPSQLLQSQTGIPPSAGWLYHYTSNSGAKGILEGKNLWASHIAYLNDRTEYIHGTQTYKSEVVNVGRSLGRNSALIEMVSSAFDQLRIPDMYSVSFSTCGDDLSQWRAYSGTSGGYSLGFEFHFFRTLASSLDCTLGVCIYEGEKKKELGREFAQRFWQDFDCSPGGTPDPHRVIVRMSEFLDELAAGCLFMKDSNFLSENEYRLVVPRVAAASTRVKSRIGAHGIVPYYEVPICPAEHVEGGPIERPHIRIVTGPSREQQLAERAVKTIVDHEDYWVADYILSAVPLR